MKQGYVLVRYADEEVLPAVIDADHKWIDVGQEVMLDERGETAIAVTDVCGHTNAEEEIGKIAALFHRDADKLPCVIGIVRREYWATEAEKDWRSDL